jgi:elongation factor Ts
MADISLEKIKELRNRTGVGIHSVKEALQASDGDVNKAIIYLREKGMAKAAKRAGNATNNGVIGHYIHGNTIGVLVELLSETDFASKSDEFAQLAKELAMHIAAKSPEYINISDVPADVLETEKQVYRKDLEGKPEQIQEKILEGKLQSFYEETVLMEQSYVRDEEKKIKDLLNEKVAALGEKIVVKGFTRMQLGVEPIYGSTVDSAE